EREAEAIAYALGGGGGAARIDKKKKFCPLATLRPVGRGGGRGDIDNPYKTPPPPIAGTATDPDSKGLIALGRRGWWPISSHFLHPNCLKSQWANYAKGCAEGGHRRSARTGAWRARSSSPRTTRWRGPTAAMIPIALTGST